jgi:hypothetical protein
VNHLSHFLELTKNAEKLAGEVTARSSTLKSIMILSVKLITVLEVKQSFLLSSRTEFIFSIQSASTGPSRTMQRISDFLSSEHILVISERISFVYSCVS